MTTHRLQLGVLALVLCLGAVPALAADGPTPAEQAHMNALAQQLGNDDAQTQPTQTADLFGPSDEEKAAVAAAAQHEQNQDSNIARLNQGVGDLQDELRKLTGQIEVLNHRIDELDQRIDRMKKDFDYKLCQASAQQLGASAQAGQPNGIPCGGEGQSAAPPAAYVPPQQGADAQPTGVTHLAPPPGVLGTLPQQTPMPAPVTVPETQPPAQLASNNTGSQTNAQYEAAMNMLARQQYDAASGAFRNFADANPNDPHAPDALYWLGDVSYVQKDFATASRSFAEVIKKYPTSTRAPESMLKLGQSLIGMNQKDEGCTALRALPAKYPSASRTVLAQAEAVRKSGGCSRH